MHTLLPARHIGHGEDCLYTAVGAPGWRGGVIHDTQARHAAEELQA